VEAYHLFASIPVAEIGAATRWYGNLAGRPPDLVPNESEAAWRVAGESGWIYLIADPDRAGSGLSTLLVDDLDALLAQIGERGVAAGPVETLAGGSVRRATITDPDGNRLNVGQAQT
jgi:hypothetical protein